MIAKTKPSGYSIDVLGSDPYRIRIFIPKLPPSLNVWSRKHWAVRQKEVSELTQALAVLARSENVPCIHKAAVKLIYTFPTKRKRDIDNYSGKFVFDALRHAGIIQDDSFGLLKISGIEFKYDPQNPGTEVLVEEITEGGNS